MKCHRHAADIGGVVLPDEDHWRTSIEEPKPNVKRRPNTVGAHLPKGRQNPVTTDFRRWSARASRDRSRACYHLPRARRADCPRGADATNSSTPPERLTSLVRRYFA